MELQIIILAFAIIGAGLKYIDEAFDEEAFDKRWAAALATVLVVLWIGLSILDAPSGTILLSILLGVLITGKIDNTVFGASTAAIFSAFLFFQKIVPLIPIAMLTASGVLDEKGNDYVDAHGSNRFLRFFFLHRFTMKIGMLLLCLAGFFPLIYLAAFLFFDIAYDGVGLISASKKIPSKGHLNEKTPLSIPV